MYMRRIIDTSSFVLAVLIGAYIQYGMEWSWIAAIGFGVLIFLATPFIVSRLWAKHLIARMERQIGE